MRPVATLAALALVGGLAGGGWWLARSDDDARPQGGSPPASPVPTVPIDPVDVDDPELEAAESDGAEDSYYPEAGDPGVDALHYHLDVTWLPDERTLRGVTTLTFRSTEDAGRFRLDLAEPLEVSSVTVGDRAVDFEHSGKDLVIEAPVESDQRYTAVIAYAGTPEPESAPTHRADVAETGWTITERDETWTMQVPYGAYTWYPVNDRPGDKALYDFTVTVESPWVGVANGTLISREEVDGNTVTHFELADPAASYLITMAIGDYEMRTDESASGVPLNYWALAHHRGAFRDLSYTAEALDWLEGKLGRYPFDSAGIVLTDSTSGMETQTLITLGDTPYARSKEVIVHELAHQWYGDLVTPADWRDMWMNEGMAMYLQLAFRAETTGRDLDRIMAGVRQQDQALRNEAGPPGAYDREYYGSGNVYYCPALMWHELRRELGDEEFWRLTRRWPRTNAHGNATREEWFAWIEEQTGRELSAFFDAWLLGERTPPA